MSNTTSFGYPIPTVRKVSALRQRMIDDMTVRNFAPNTQVSYLHQVNLFARHFDKSPERLGPEEIRTYQIYLAKERHAAVGTRSVAVSALRFLYKVTLRRDWPLRVDSGSQVGNPTARDSQSGGSSAAAASRSVLSSPRHLQHDVRDRGTRQ